MSGMERLQRMLGIYQVGAGSLPGPGEAWDQPGFRRYFPEMDREEFVLEYDFLFRARTRMWRWSCGPPDVAAGEMFSGTALPLK